MELMFAKIVTTFATLVMLVTVARRLGSDWAGVLAGFPLGSAITLYFYGVEQGTEFAIDAANHTLIGLCSCLLLAISYGVVVRRRMSNSQPLISQPSTSQQPQKPQQTSTPLRALLLPALTAMLAFLLLASLLAALPSHPVIATGIIAVAIWLSHRALQHWPDTQPQDDPDNVWQRPKVALFTRASLASLSVLLITALAHWLSPAAAGTLAAFPVSFFPTLLILHLSYGAPVVLTTIKHYPSGLGAMVVYVLAVGPTYQAFGLHMGTALSLLCALTYLLLFAAWRRRKAPNS
ncbi:MAG: hypothetical protein VXZ05_06260 [Pseudomonadota bacterium]|nr:hypothetical protein [Pseudomonadota bacterium]